MALVAPPMADFRGESNSALEESHIFFRFVDGRHISLMVDPDSEIRACKKQLIQKVALLNAAASSQNSIAASPQKHGAANESVVCVLWMALQLLSSSFYKLRPSDLYFMHHGKPLDDDALWKDYVGYGGSSSNRKNITSTMTVTVHPRVRGGCFMVSASVLAMLCTAVVGASCTCGMSLIAVPLLLPLLFVLPLFCL